MPRPKTNREPITLFLPPRLNHLLRTQAAVEKLRLSDIVERALEHELKDTPYIDPPEEENGE